MNIFKQYEQSKAHQHYIVILFTFLPFFLMVLSGLVMLKFHVSQATDMQILGMHKSYWLFFHKCVSLIATYFVCWHVLQHKIWLKSLFFLRLNAKYKILNITLLVVFLLTATSSILSWLIFKNSDVGEGLKGIHSKAGFLSMIIVIFHVKNYFFWIKKMTIKIFFQVNNA